MKITALKTFAWLLSLTVTIMAVVAWGQLYDWQLSSLTPYQVFPLFGLLAFSIMWSHYIVSAARQYLGVERALLMPYFKATSWAVLFSIVMHPSLLIVQLF